MSPLCTVSIWLKRLKDIQKLGYYSTYFKTSKWRWTELFPFELIKKLALNYPKGFCLVLSSFHVFEIYGTLSWIVCRLKLDGPTPIALWVPIAGFTIWAFPSNWIYWSWAQCFSSLLFASVLPCDLFLKRKKRASYHLHFTSFSSP